MGFDFTVRLLKWRSGCVEFCFQPRAIVIGAFWSNGPEQSGHPTDDGNYCMHSADVFHLWFSPLPMISLHVVQFYHRGTMLMTQAGEEGPAFFQRP
jgi:hypothetical protein